MAKDKRMVQTFRSHRPYPALRDGIRPWRLDRCPELLDSEGSDPAVEHLTVAAITVVNQIARWFPFAATGLHHLLGQPLCGGMSSRSDMHKLSSAMIDHEKHIQGPKPDRLNCEEITRPDPLSVLRQKPTPARRRDTIVGVAHVLRDSPGADPEAQPGEFRLDSLLAP